MKKEERKEIEHFKKENKKQEKKKKNKANYRWVLTITIVAFLVSFLFSLISEYVLPSASLTLGIIIVFLFIGLGILFDMIGVAVTSAEEIPFHSMSAKKVRGANVAVTFKRNADKVGSFCNDVIGDICGVISGSLSVLIASNIAKSLALDPVITSLIVTATIAALTIGGKALGKNIAIKKSNIILYYFAKSISFVYHPKKK